MEPNVSTACGSYSSEHAGTCFYEISLPQSLPLASSFWSRLESTNVPELLLPVSVPRTAQVALVSAVVLAIPFILVYIATWKSFAHQDSQRLPVRIPGTVPYMVPWLGSALHFGLHPSSCLAAAR